MYPTPTAERTMLALGATSKSRTKNVAFGFSGKDCAIAGRTGAKTNTWINGNVDTARSVSMIERDEAVSSSKILLRVSEKSVH